MLSSIAAAIATSGAIAAGRPLLALLLTVLGVGLALAIAIDFQEIQPQLTPDVQVETDWSGGRTGLAIDQKKLLVLGHKTSSGSATAGQVYSMTSRAQAIGLFGKGSELACMCEAALSIAPMAPIFAVAYAENVGGVQAHADIVLATTATGPGTLVVTIAGRRFSVGIAKNDTPTVTGDALAAAVNAHANCPVTASNSSGTVTITARNKGTAGNSIRMSGSITSSCGMTATIAAVLASGATDGDPATALAGVEGDRYHLIAHNLQDVTTVPILKTDREKQSGVTVKKWGLGIVGCTGTRGTAETLQGTSGVASYRMQFPWQNECPRPCFELAAAFGALRATKAANVSLDDVVLPGFTPAVDETKWPNAAEIEAAQRSGLTPMRPLRDGTVQVVRSVIAKTQAQVPYYIDHMTIEISDYCDEFIIRLLSERAKGKRLKSGSAPGSPGTMTPQRINAILNEGLYLLDKADYIQGVQDALDEGLNFTVINSIDPNRTDSGLRFWPIAFAHFCAVKKNYVTAGDQ